MPTSSSRTQTQTQQVSSTTADGPTKDGSTSGFKWWMGGIGLLVAIIVGNWLFLYHSFQSTNHQRLDTFHHALDNFTHAVLPLYDEEDMRVMKLSMKVIDTQLIELQWMMKTQPNPFELDPTLLHQFYSIPYRVLNAQVALHSGMTKALLANEAARVTSITPQLLKQYSRSSDVPFSSPLSRALEMGLRSSMPIKPFCWTKLLSGESMTPLEFAVDRNLLIATYYILDTLNDQKELHGTSESCPAPLFSEPRFNLFQLAQNNGNQEMEGLLKEYQHLLPTVTVQDPERERKRSAILKHPIDFSVFNLPPIIPTKKPTPSIAHGGWRPSASNRITNLISSLPPSTCPIARLPAQQLTAGLFRTFYENHQPLILTDALDTTQFSIGEYFTRRNIETNWGGIDVTAGEIPYGEHFGRKTGVVNFHEFLAYMDQLYNDDKPPSDQPTSPPFYIFDYTMLSENWIQTMLPITSPVGVSFATSIITLFRTLFDSLLSSYFDTVSSPPSPSTSTSSSSVTNPLSFFNSSFYRLPNEILTVLNTTSMVPQFYLGPEGSGAPFHFHCPAMNLLVYGKKHWWLHPPHVGLYSKEFPLDSLQRLYRNDADHSTEPASTPIPYSCVQQENELWFIPTGWSHATLNEMESIGIAVEFDMGGC